MRAGSKLQQWHHAVVQILEDHRVSRWHARGAAAAGSLFRCSDTIHNSLLVITCGALIKNQV